MQKCKTNVKKLKNAKKYEIFFLNAKKCKNAKMQKL